VDQGTEPAADELLNRVDVGDLREQLVDAEIFKQGGPLRRTGGYLHLQREQGLAVRARELGWLGARCAHPHSAAPVRAHLSDDRHPELFPVFVGVTEHRHPA
jgi:hypothetical protein